MNLRHKRLTPSDLVPNAKAVKELTFEQMEALYNHRKLRIQEQKKWTAQPIFASPEAR